MQAEEAYSYQLHWDKLRQARRREVPENQARIREVGL